MSLLGLQAYPKGPVTRWPVCSPERLFSELDEPFLPPI